MPTRKRTGAIGGKWTVDEIPLPCPCGTPVHWLRRGKLRKIPAGHYCRFRERQEAECRTIRLIETVVRVTPGEARERIESAFRD